MFQKLKRIRNKMKVTSIVSTFTGTLALLAIAHEHAQDAHAITTHLAKLARKSAADGGDGGESSGGGGGGRCTSQEDHDVWYKEGGVKSFASDMVECSAREYVEDYLSD